MSLGYLIVDLVRPACGTQGGNPMAWCPLTNTCEVYCNTHIFETFGDDRECGLESEKEFCSNEMTCNTASEQDALTCPTSWEREFKKKIIKCVYLIRNYTKPLVSNYDYDHPPTEYEVSEWIHNNGFFF